ncbi:MAG: pilus assembly FimT family protein [Eubacteriales bacterium]
MFEQGLSSRNLYYRDSKAFTLLEMMVVLAILSLLVGLVFVNFNIMDKLIEKQNLRTQCREILQSLLTHKNHGLMMGCIKKVYIFEDEMYIQTIKESIITEKIFLKDDIQVTSNTYYGKHLEMKPMGTVNCGGHITFETKSGDKMTIVIQLGTGRIYLKDGGL